VLLTIYSTLTSNFNLLTPSIPFLQYITYTSNMAETTAPIELPVIDISNPHDPTVGKAMLEAAAKYGFLYVNSKGTDFKVEDVDHAFGLVGP
jgi:hypothetical protein